MYVEIWWRPYECNTCSNDESIRFNKGVSIHYEKDGPFATSFATGFSNCIGHLQLGVFCTPLVLTDKLHKLHWTNYIIHQTIYIGAPPCNCLRLKNNYKPHAIFCQNLSTLRWNLYLLFIHPTHRWFHLVHLRLIFNYENIHLTLLCNYFVI